MSLFGDSRNPPDHDHSNDLISFDAPTAAQYDHARHILEFTPPQERVFEYTLLDASPDVLDGMWDLEAPAQEMASPQRQDINESDDVLRVDQSSRTSGHQLNMGRNEQPSVPFDCIGQALLSIAISGDPDDFDLFAPFDTQDLCSPIAQSHASFPRPQLSPGHQSPTSVTNPGQGLDTTASRSSLAQQQHLETITPTMGALQEFQVIVDSVFGDLSASASASVSASSSSSFSSIDTDDSDETGIVKHGSIAVYDVFTTTGGSAADDCLTSYESKSAAWDWYSRHMSHGKRELYHRQYHAVAEKVTETATTDASTNVFGDTSVICQPPKVHSNGKGNTSSFNKTPAAIQSGGKHTRRLIVTSNGSPVRRGTEGGDMVGNTTPTKLAR